MTVILDGKRKHTHIKVGDETFTPTTYPDKHLDSREINGLHTTVQEFIDEPDFEKLAVRLNVGVAYIVNALRKADKLPLLTKKEISDLNKQNKMYIPRPGTNTIPRIILTQWEFTNPVWDKVSKHKSLTFDYNG